MHSTDSIIGWISAATNTRFNLMDSLSSLFPGCCGYWTNFLVTQ